MDICSFAINHGFIEAKLRGYRSTFLTNEHYSQIKSLNTLEELLQYLQTETDYGEYIDLNHQSIHALKKLLKAKLNDEITHVEINCQREVSELIFFIRAEHMIDNIMSILDDIQNGIPFKKLINNIEPLGQLSELSVMEAVASDIAVLYETVLVDTPLAEIFSIYLEESSRELKNF